MNSDFQEHSRKSRPFTDGQETGERKIARKHTTLTFQESTRKSGEHFQNSWWQDTEKEISCPQSTKDGSQFEEDSQNSSNGTVV